MTSLMGHVAATNLGAWVFRYHAGGSSCLYTGFINHISSLMFSGVSVLPCSSDPAYDISPQPTQTQRQQASSPVPHVPKYARGGFLLVKASFPQSGRGVARVAFLVHETGELAGGGGGLADVSRLDR